MSLKNLTRSAAVAWCPSGAWGLSVQEGTSSSSSKTSSTGGDGGSRELLALGTMGVDPRLEFASFDLSSPSASLPVVASVGAPSPFQCIATAITTDLGSANACLVAGGMSEGDVTLWNAGDILNQGVASGDSGSSGLLQTVEVQRGQRVQALQFNSLRPSLLAAGTSSGGLSIVDVEIATEAVAHKPGADGAAGDDCECTCLSWNASVAHIIATGTGTGQTVVWDLKQRKHAISFCDPQHRHSRPSSVLWLPNQPTQLLLVYDDDRKPSPQLWDLRNATFPLKEAIPQPPYGHTRGIVSASLCPADSRMVLTCGRDSRLVCWWLPEESVQQQQQTHSSGIEVYVQQQAVEPYMQVLWSPTAPGVYAAATPMQVSVCSLLASNCAAGSPSSAADRFYPPEDSRIMGPSSSKFIPSWFKKPRAVDFSSSGRLAYSTSLSHSALMLRSVEEFTETKLEETDAHETGQLAAAFAAQVQQLDGLIRQQCWADICTLQLQQMERQQHQSESEDREVWSALLDTLNGRIPNLGGSSREELQQQLETLLGHPLPSVQEQQRQKQLLLQQQQEQEQQMQMQQQMQQHPMYGYAMHPQQHQQQEQGYINGPGSYPGYPLSNGNGTQQQQQQQQQIAALTAVDPEKFFSQLGGAEERESSKDQQEQQREEESASGDVLQQQQQQQEQAVKPNPASSRASSQHGDIDWTSAPWQLLRECLLTGSIEGAVELLKVYGTLSDALLLAGAAAAAPLPQQQQQQQQRQSSNACLWEAAEGQGLAIWRTVAEAYVHNMQDEFFKLFGFAVLDCLDSLVTEVSLVCWREALRLLGSYARDKDTYYRLARQLGERLSASGDLKGALVCFITSRDFPAACDIWLQQLQQRIYTHRSKSSSSGSNYFAQPLLNTIQKMLVFRAAANFQGPCPAFERVALAYADEASSLSCGSCAMLVLRLYLGVGSTNISSITDGAAAAGSGQQALESSLRAAALELAMRLYYSNPTAMERAGFTSPNLRAESSGFGGAMQRQQQQQQQRQPVRSMPPAQPSLQQQQPPFLQQQQQRGHDVPSAPPPQQQQQQMQQQSQQFCVPRMLPASGPSTQSGALGPVHRPSPATNGLQQGFLPNGSQQQHQHHQQRDMFPQNPGSVSRVAPISSAGFMSPSPALGAPRGVPPPPVSAATGGTAVPGGSVLRPAAPASSFGFTAPQSAPAPSNASTGNIAGGTGALGGAPGVSLAAPPGSLASAGPGASGFGHAGGFPRLPPTGEGGHSPAPYSAPTVGAQPVKPGMPVPWPIPTAAQLNQRATKSTYAANMGINKASEKGTEGKALPPDQQAFVRSVLSGLLQMQQGPSAQDLSNKVEDLLLKLQQGELSGSGCEKVVALCSALQGGDIAQAQRLHADLSATEWHASNRQWLMGLKRLIPKP